MDYSHYMDDRPSKKPTNLLQEFCDALGAQHDDEPFSQSKRWTDFLNSFPQTMTIVLDESEVFRTDYAEHMDTLETSSKIHIQSNLQDVLGEYPESQNIPRISCVTHPQQLKSLLGIPNSPSRGIKICPTCFQIRKCQHQQPPPPQMPNDMRFKEMLQMVKVWGEYICESQCKSCIGWIDKTAQIRSKKKKKYNERVNQDLLQTLKTNESLLTGSRQLQIQASLRRNFEFIKPGTTFCAMAVYMEEEFRCIDIYLTIKRYLYQPVGIEIRKHTIQSPIEISEEEQDHLREQRSNQNSETTKSQEKLIFEELFSISKSMVCYGAGLFAMKPLEALFEIQYQGQNLNMKQLAKREIYYESIEENYIYTTSDNKCVDAFFYGGPARYVNHMMETYANVMFYEKPNGKVVLQTKRAIKAGEEIFACYGDQFKLSWVKDFDNFMKKNAVPKDKPSG